MKIFREIRAFRSDLTERRRVFHAGAKIGPVVPNYRGGIIALMQGKAGRAPRAPSPSAVLGTVDCDSASWLVPHVTTEETDRAA